MVVLSALLGLVVGLLIAGAALSARVRAARDAAASANTQLKVRESELANALETAARLREEHTAALANMESLFENVSNRVLNKTVHQFNESQEQVQRERSETLGRTLAPLKDALDEYKRSLSEFDKQHVSALSDVKNRAEELLAEQKRSQDETRRLNQLLGRSDQRGRWGEIQLANILQAAGLEPGIDYDLQVSAVSETGRVQRPDCVVNMPNGSRIAVDAKFPFDAFEAAMSSSDPLERRELYAKHSRDLRSHVKTLREKAYWQAIQPSPEFVACFVPSDVAIAAAFEADPELYTHAAKERVLIVGPTTLLSLLWSVAVVIDRHKLALNAEKIYDQAARLFDRIRLVAEPVDRMGKALATSVEQYNKMVDSFESRLLVTARQVRSLGGAAHLKDLPELVAIEKLTHQPNAQSWGVDENGPAEGASEILALEGLEESDFLDE
ncbi:MAG TPA: DNA recombination protein RmuC [Acidimicrobiales bacterium]|nr:DNA recombination protein RmuC [Acidimicrobiales bacterium]